MVNTRKVEEQQLQEVYQSLLRKRQELQQLIAVENSEGKAAIQEMTGEVRVNYDNFADNLDTYANIEALNRQIDQYNQQLATARKQLDKVERLLPSPYFGKITAHFTPDEAAENFYIGINGFTDDQKQELIYDWRSPIAELFYNNQLGVSAYQVDTREISVVIDNRRQLITDGDYLVNWFDSGTAIQDDVLLAALAQDNSSQMTDITTTIQVEQDKIIRDRLSPVVLVNGVAGSGKTSTVMQRIAYLLYRDRDKYSADEMLILSPNRSFGKYIAQVLPNLGEENPATYTLLQLVARLGGLEGELESEKAYFQRISIKETSLLRSTLRDTDFLVSLTAISGDEVKPQFRDILHGEKALITKEHIQLLFNETPAGQLADRLQAVKARLLQEWERHLIRQGRSNRIRQQLLGLTEAEQQRLLGGLIEFDSEAKLSEYGLQLLQKRYRDISRQIQDFSWLQAERLFADCYFNYTGEALPPLLKKMDLDLAVAQLYMHHVLIEPLTVPDFKVILVDEVQDYTPAQLQFIRALFPKAHFTLVGDENQAIFDSQTDFSRIAAIFGKKQVTGYSLVKSYRSSGNITRLFGALLKDPTKLEIQAVRPEGAPITWLSVAEKAEMVQTVTDYVVTTGLTALTVLTKTLAQAEELRQLLPKDQISVYPIALAKGLEFSNVLIYDASKKNYHSGRDRQLLYTGISRGTETVALLWQKNKSPLFA
ncbi:HelD family protein [Enterococcus sp. AD013-P3]|uniref:HelD family protein n=1 Tax=Enterococcus sp. AD013-P3 TaxID=3411036 RepID=UPI003B9548F3